MTAKSKSLQRQVERVLDSSPDREVEVIVQMEPARDKSRRLARAAGEALNRRRFSLTPRDLLPGTYEKTVSRQQRQATASTRTLLGSDTKDPRARATAETLALARIQQMASGPRGELLKSGVARAALERMRRPKKKSGAAAADLGWFWTSQSMILRLGRDEVPKLTKEVGNIKAIHLNRWLSVPAVMETRPLAIEEGEIRISTWGLDRIKALAAWGAFGAKGQGVIIGLLDTGVDASHPDLDGKISAWAEFDSLGRLVPSSKPHDSDEHGTHCAGTLVGGTASGRATGVAPEAKIAAALVLNGEEGGTDAQVLKGIDWAVEHQVDVISMSLGGLVMDAEMPPTYTEAILSCVEAGIPVVAAIGNEGEQTTGSPGNDIFALSVGATDPDDRVAGFSGGRTHIVRESDFIEEKFLPLPFSKPDLSAPGVAIYSSVPGGGWKALSGTSMAAPHVAGAIALLLSATGLKAKEFGAFRSFAIQDLIIGSVKDLGETGQDHRYGFGRLDILRAIDFAHQRGY
jgi:hypothetical protein